MDITIQQTLQNVVFVDLNDISNYAVDAVGTMVRAGIMSDKPGNISDPICNTTRSEFAAMLHQFAEAVR